MHCSGLSQSITHRFAAVVEVFVIFFFFLSLCDKVLLSRAFILLLLLLLTGERVSVRSVGDDGTNSNDALG